VHISPLNATSGVIHEKMVILSYGFVLLESLFFHSLLIELSLKIIDGAWKLV
jgi:hypothetical protein